MRKSQNVGTKSAFMPKNYRGKRTKTTKSKSKLLNHQNKPISMLCSPSNYSPFFIGMAKEARTRQILI